MKRRLLGVAAAVCLSILTASPSWAQSDRAKVDGDAWLNSTPDVRKSFLIGASSMVALDRAYSRRKGTPASVVGSRTAEALEDLTLDEVSARITRWYEANPDRRRMPVMAVVWIDIVNPRDRR
jgi:hypothetical protein